MTTFDIVVVMVAAILAAVWIVYVKALWAADDEQRRLGVRQ